MQHPPKKMQSNRSKPWLIPVLALAVLLLAVVLVLAMPGLRQKKEPIEVTTVSQRVFEVTEAERISSVTISPEWGESYTLCMHNGTLMLDEDGVLMDISDSYASEILSAVTQIVGQGVVAEDAQEVAEHLADMGFDTPSASARIRYTDGTETTLEIGANVPNTTYAYCRWSGSSAVYMCDSGVVDALNLTRSRLLPLEQPVIYAELLDEVLIENANDRLRITFTDGAFGRVEEPFSYPLSRNGASALMAAINSFRLGALEGPVTEENRAGYGFEEPLCTLEMKLSSGVSSEVDENGELVTMLQPERSFRFVLGRAEGEYFYTCEYEGNCYLVSRFLAERFITLRRAEVLSRNPLDVGDLALKAIEMHTQQGTAEFRISRTESVLPNNELELDAQGNVVYQTTVRLNGKESTQEMLDEVVSRLDAFTASSDAPADFSPSGAPEWSVVLETETGLVRTVEAWKMDLFTDVIAVDGVVVHCAHSEAAELLTEGLIESTGAHDR